MHGGYCRNFLAPLAVVTMMFVAGSRLRHLACLAAVGACGLAGLLLMAPYRMARLVAYTNIWADPQGDGYQPLQSLASIASGGWFGAGLGGGVQKYGYLPEDHTDFIFAVISWPFLESFFLFLLGCECHFGEPFPEFCQLPFQMRAYQQPSCSTFSSAFEH